MESSGEVRKIRTLMHVRLEHANLRQFRGSMIDDLRMGRLKHEGTVPGAAVRPAEPATSRPRMTEGRHHYGRHGPACHPLFPRNALQDTEFGRDPVVRPGFQFDYRVQILRTGNGIENPGGRVPARDKPVSIAKPEIGFRRRQSAAPSIQQPPHLQQSVNAAVSH